MAGRSDERNLFNIDLFTKDDSERRHVDTDIQKDKCNDLSVSASASLNPSDVYVSNQSQSDGEEAPSHQLLPCTVTSGPNGLCVDIIDIAVPSIKESKR